MTRKSGQRRGKEMFFTIEREERKVSKSMVDRVRVRLIKTIEIWKKEMRVGANTRDGAQRRRQTTT